MSKRDFIIFVDGLKSTLGTLTDDQWKRLLQKAVQDYRLTTEEAIEILEDSGLKVVNYLEELGLRIEELENHSEETLKKRVEDVWSPLYNKALQDYTDRGVERRKLLNRAKNTLLNPQKRRKHLAVLKTQRH